MHSIALLLAGFLAGLFAVLMLFQATLYASALCFLVVLEQIAAFFDLLGSPLLAFLQVLLYAGAIMVLVVVSIMATPPRLRRLWMEASLPRPLIVLALVLAALEFGTVIQIGALNPELPAWPALQSDLAAALFGRYAVYTEVVAVLIFLATLAVVETWRSEE
jgi:NADH-quinone oxidoreductase subunit J